MNFLKVFSFVWSESSGLSMEVLFFVAVWTNQFYVFWSSINSDFVYVMNCKYLWDFVVTASFAFVWACGKSIFSLSDDRGYGRVETAVGSEFCSTFGRAEKSVSVFEFVGKSSEGFPADHARFYGSGFSTKGFSVCYDSWHDSFCGAFSTAKSIISCIWDLLLFAARLALNDLWRLAFVMPNQKSGSNGLASQRSATPTGAHSWFGWSLGVVWKIVVFDGSLCGKVIAAPARAQLRALASLAFRQVLPTWRVVRESIFGHGLCLLGGPSLARSWASFSCFENNMPASYLQGVMA
jgi:hypothetical protein